MVNKFKKGMDNGKFFLPGYPLYGWKVKVDLIMILTVE